MAASVPAKPPLLPPYSWREFVPAVKLFYLRDRAEADSVLAQLPPGPRTVGFDMEWKPTFVKGFPENPVALVQISTEETVLLIQVSAMDRFPEKLQALLDDADVVKTGVNILGDCKKLYADYGISVRSCVELAYLARCVDAQWVGRFASPIGLARLVQAYESRSLPKGRVQLSNWEAALTAQQQDYAANDAHSGLMVYRKLAALAWRASPVPAPVHYSFDVIQGLALHPSGQCWTPNNPRVPDETSPSFAGLCDPACHSSPLPSELEGQDQSLVTLVEGPPAVPEEAQPPVVVMHPKRKTVVLLEEIDPTRSIRARRD